MPEWNPQNADDGTPADLLPATGSYPTEAVRYQNVVLTDIPGSGEDDLAELDGPVDLADEDELKSFDRPGEGMIVTIEQTWRSLGVTLGRLLHSLALAPGESTRVAVVDWSRRTRGTGAEDIGVQESLGEDATYDRSVTEVANSVALEQQFGDSTSASATVSASVSVTSGFSTGFSSTGLQGSLASNLGAATSVARSSGTRDVAARTAQDIAGRTRQLATAVRNQHVAVVRETSQSEGAQVATRVVTNYNHMHAMTVQYYEVVQAYEVATRPVLIERCLFVPMKILTFTTGVLKRYAGVLAKAAPKAWAEKMASTDPFSIAVRRTRSSSVASSAAPAPDASGTVVDRVHGKLRSISAATDGTDQWVWGVNQAGDAVRWNPANRTWNKVRNGAPAGGFIRITVGGRDTVWALSSDKFPYYLGSDDTWHKFLERGFRCIAAGSDGSVWAGGSVDGEIFRLSADRASWENVGGQANDLAVVNRDSAWHIWDDGRTNSQFDPAAKKWWQRPGELSQISAAGDGTVWGVNAGGQLYQWTGRDNGENAAGSWVERTYSGVDRYGMVAPVSDRELWVLTADNSPVHIVTAGGTGTQSPVDRHDDKGEAESLTVHWDDKVVRGIELTLRGSTDPAGPTIVIGDTNPSLGLTSDTHTFGPADRLESITVHVGTATGGNVRGIVLTTTAGASTTFGHEDDDGTDGSEPVNLDVRGMALCGLFGLEGSNTTGRYVASLGCWVRGEAAASDVLDHLNDNAAHYSRAIWANADELELSRVLASYHYTPRGSAEPVPLAVRLDPRPVAITGNYLAFRWHFGSKKERRKWLKRNVDTGGYPEPMVVGLPSRGVFAEAVLGRANSAEKLDVTRFWNWQDSPIPILPPEIEPASAGSRASEVDVRAGAMAAPTARINPLPDLPAPTGLDSILRTVATANLFRDMSGLAGTQDVLSKGLELAATNDREGAKNATQAMRIAAEHAERMADRALKAAPMLLGPEGAVLAKLAGGDGVADALGGMVGGAIGGRNVSEYGALLNSQPKGRRRGPRVSGSDLGDSGSGYGSGAGRRSRPTTGSAITEVDDERPGDALAGTLSKLGRSGGSSAARTNGPRSAGPSAGSPLAQAYRMIPEFARRNGISVERAEQWFREAAGAGEFDLD